MEKLRISMMGIPQVHVNEENIKLPFKKAEALLYYMVIEKEATRDQLVNLFWADSVEEISKKNLRNAIYIIKKTLGIEVFLSPKRSMIMINPDIEIEIDVENGLKIDNNHEFLSGMYLKNCEDFDLWLSSQRQYYEDRSIGLLRNKINEGLNRSDHKKVTSYCKELLKIDQFDEEVYRIMMQNYFNAGRFDKSIKVFDNLVNLLDEELSISPDEDTVNLYNDILKKRAQIKIAKKQSSGKFFFGRKTELADIRENYFNYIQGQGYNHIVVIGEAGVGKTELINQFISSIDDNQVYTLRTQCYKATEGFILKSWDSIIDDLGSIVLREQVELPDMVKQTIQSVFPAFLLDQVNNVHHQVNNTGMYEMKIVENALVELFSIISKFRRIVLIVEDIHWTDRISLSLLERVILNGKVNIMMISSCRKSYDDITEKFITKIGANAELDRLYLRRFNEDETLDFAKEFLPEHMISKMILDNIFVETEGNSFFLTEVLNNIINGESYKIITSKIQDVLKHRILNLTNEGQKLVQIASIFFDSFSIEGLIKISGKSEIDVLETIEELIQKNILKELLDSRGKLIFAFTHQKIREFIYNDLTLSKKKILHERIAKFYESKLNHVKQDRRLYHKLIIHYDGAQNNKKVLEFSISNLYVHLQSIHEVFPLVNHKEIIDHVNVFIDEDQVLDEFSKLEDLYKKVYNEYGDSRELLKLKISLLHMESRYYINNGIYDKGLEYSDKLLSAARKIGDKQYEIRAFLVKIHYSINSHKMDIMKETIHQALTLAKDHNFKYETGILQRLSGLNNILVGNYELGEKLLFESIEMMSSFEDSDKYILNIAAAYYYLGDSYKFRGNFMNAIKYYQEAINTCNEHGIIGRLTIFYTNAGQVYFNMKDHVKANEYLDKALELYNMLDFPWRRSIAYGFKGLILANDGQVKAGVELLMKMEYLSEKQRNPYEIATKYRLKSELALLFEKGMIKGNGVASYLDGVSSIEYAKRGIKSLNRFDRCYEMTRLKELAGVNQSY